MTKVKNPKGDQGAMALMKREQVKRKEVSSPFNRFMGRRVGSRTGR